MNGMSTLGIIAGSGNLPLHIIKACKERPVFVIGIEGTTDMKPYANVPHAEVHIGAAGELVTQLQKANVNDVILAGALKRPAMSSLRPDAKGAKLMTKIATRLLLGGDDALLREIIAFFESEGFDVIGAHEAAPDLIAPLGVLGKIAPSADDQSDIAIGMKAAKALGKRDVGQAVIVDNGKVIAKEDAKGTEALIARAKGGILVKALKPGQEKRVDLPTIGVDTVEQAHGAKLRGIAIEAGNGIMLDKAELIKKADALGLFVIGAQDE